MDMAPKEFSLGLESGQFLPCFQPVVWLHTGELDGFEILARWRHPQLGMIPPDTFVPMAEAEGWIDELMVSLIRQAFEAVSALPRIVRLSVNVSSAQLKENSLPDEIEKVANQAEFPLHQLSIEIAAAALRENPEQAQAIGERLKALGCRIELDDFGTGDASVRQVQVLPLDALKLDRSIVQSMMEHPESRKMVEAAVRLGQSLHIRTVAKGVQSREQAELLLAMGCDLGQGWFYGEPVPPDELGEIVRQNILGPTLPAEEG